MKIEEAGGRFYVYRERGDRRSYFSFWVSNTGSSWTRHQFAAVGFPSEAKAQECINEINRRDKNKRTIRKAGNK